MSIYYVVEYRDTYYPHPRISHARKDNLESEVLAFRGTIEDWGTELNGSVVVNESSNLQGANTWMGEIGFGQNYSPFRIGKIDTSIKPFIGAVKPDPLPPYAGTIEYAVQSVPQAVSMSVTNISKKSASVNWSPKADLQPITSYHYVLVNQNKNITVKDVNLQSGQRNSFEQNLDSGTNYKAYVIAVNKNGNSLESNIAFKTLGSIPVITTPDPIPQPEPTPDPIPQPTPTPDYNFIIESDGLVRVIRLTGSKTGEEIKLSPASAQINIDRGYVRLLTAQERIGTVIPEPELKFCVNTYNIRDSGSVYSTHYESITQQKVQELQQTQLVVACDADYLPTEKQVQDFYGFTPLPPTVDTSINETMVSQSIGAFILKEGIVKGEILYIANEAKYDNENKLITGFNPFYYGKNLTSLVQIKSKSGVILVQKPNDLNFTETERDERIYIDENVQNYKELTIDFFVWDSAISGLRFASTKQIQVVEELPPPDPFDPKPPTTCQIGYHKDFSGKCVPDDPPGELPRDKLIDTIKGFLFGTVALSLLARKY
tara:strand:+ start:54 stop:1685 length:1632 start_codon:yes stop_codon:yes gene_type:complete